MEETVILNFEVDQSKALKDLQKTEKAILNLKEEQADLNKEYKAGKISQEEYVRQNIKLQSALKKENDQKRVLNKALETESNSRDAMRQRVANLTREYNNLNLATEKGIKRADELQKELKQLSDTINQGSIAAGNFKDNVARYPDAFGAAIENVNVAGTSIGDLGAKISSFLTPATAAVGIVGALGAAYASSSTGARDLANANNLLAGAFTEVNNQFAEFINSATGGTGDPEKGIFSFVVTGLLQRFAPATAAIAQLSANAKKELMLLELAVLDSQAAAKKALDEAEKLRRQRDDDANTLEDRLRFANEVEIFINQRETALVQVQEDRLKALNTLLALDKNNLDLQKEIKQTQFEISDILEDSQGKRTEALNQIILLERELAAVQAENAKRQSRIGRLATREEGALVGGPGISDVPLVQPKSSQDAAIEAQQQFANELLKVNQNYYDADVRNKRAAAELKEQIDQQQLQNTAMFLAQGAALFDENTAAFKIFASASTLISTYSAAQKAYEAAFLPVPTVASPALGAAFAAVAVASGLANVARINGVEFAEGGFTGAGGKYEPAGIVHKGEYVVPQSVNYSPAAQPHIAALESMRMKGYADGGFVASQNIASSQQALMTANMLKNMPAPIVSVKEVTKVQNRIQAREKLARQ